LDEAQGSSYLLLVLCFSTTHQHHNTLLTHPHHAASQKHPKHPQSKHPHSSASEPLRASASDHFTPWCRCPGTSPQQRLRATRRISFVVVLPNLVCLRHRSSPVPLTPLAVPAERVSERATSFVQHPIPPRCSCDKQSSYISTNPTKTPAPKGLRRLQTLHRRLTMAIYSLSS